MSRGQSRGWLASFLVLQEARTHVELGSSKAVRQGHTRVICTNLLEGRDLTKLLVIYVSRALVKELLTELQPQERECQYGMSHKDFVQMLGVLTK